MTRRRIVLLTAAVLGLFIAASLAIGWRVYGDLVPPRFEPMVPVSGVGTLSAQTCGSCHLEIFEQWKRSGHARAFVDPLYQAELPHQRVTFPCHRCHAPLVEQRERLTVGLWAAWPALWPITVSNDRFDPLLRDEGVTCVVCHQVDDAIVGPFDDAVSPHPTAVRDLRDPGLCGRCHQLGFEVVGKLDRPIIDTMREWEGYRSAGGDKVCADCHLAAGPTRPLAKGAPVRPTVDHSLLGPFDPEFVRTAVEITPEAMSATYAGGASAAVRLANKTGHRLPGGEPQRSLRLRLRALDPQGVELGQTSQVLHRPIDVVKLRELAEDTTLAPLEERRIELRLPAPLSAAVATVQLRVDFYLWDPEHEAASEAGFSLDDLVQPLFERTVIVRDDASQL